MKKTRNVLGPAASFYNMQQNTIGTLTNNYHTYVNRQRDMYCIHVSRFLLSLLTDVGLSTVADAFNSGRNLSSDSQ